MKPIQVYQCEYCKKLFKTPDKHKCKYNPEFRNCFSCKRNKGFEEEHEYNGQTSIYLVCDSEDDTVDARNAKKECDDYIYCGGKWFENDYAKENDTKRRNEGKALESWFG